MHRVDRCLRCDDDDHAIRPRSMHTAACGNIPRRAFAPRSADNRKRKDHRYHARRRVLRRRRCNRGGCNITGRGRSYHQEQKERGNIAYNTLTTPNAPASASIANVNLRAWPIAALTRSCASYQCKRSACACKLRLFCNVTRRVTTIMSIAPRWKPGNRNGLLGTVAARVAATALVRCDPRPRILLHSGERLSSQRAFFDRIRILRNIRRRLLRSEGASHKSIHDNQKFSRRLRTRVRSRGVARMIGPVETACQVDFCARVVRLRTAQPKSGGGRRQLEPRWSGRWSKLSIATIASSL